MKVLISNLSKQHTEIYYWQRTAGDEVRRVVISVPGGCVTEAEAPDDQIDTVRTQCHIMGLKLKEEV